MWQFLQQFVQKGTQQLCSGRHPCPQQMWWCTAVPSKHWSDFTVAESQHSWVWKGPLEVIGSNLPAQAGPEASEQTELQEVATLHVLVCRKCIMPLMEAGAWGDGLLACRMCVLIQDLCQQAKDLYEVSRLCSIRDDKKEKDWIFSETPQLQEPEVRDWNRVGGCRFLHL